MNILEAQYNWLVRKGTKLVRNEGVPFYIIAQYLTNLDLIIEGHTKHAKCGSIIVLEPNKKHSYYCKEELIHHWIHIEGKDFSNLLTHYNITKTHYIYLTTPTNSHKSSDKFNFVIIVLIHIEMNI